MIDRQLLIQLTLIKGLGPVAIKALEQAVGDAVCTTLDELRAFIAGSNAAKYQRLLAWSSDDARELDRELRELERGRFTVLTWHDAAYPELLRSIHAPPPVLYVWGTLPIGHGVGVVGSRAANSYGLAAADQLVPICVREGWTVVSGGARGIDARAHKAALQAGGKTVVVLGSGLCSIYPREHTNLFGMIAEKHGAVVSPFPLWTAPVPGNFPARNRVIAGLCRGIVVIQAAEKSGALITAMSAADEGREVAVVPGSIMDPLSTGAHRLLAEGAAPITGEHALVQWLQAMGGAEGAIVRTHEHDVEEDAAVIQDVVVPKAAPAPVAVVTVDPIVAYCKERARSCEEIGAACALEPNELFGRLWQLQVAAQIEQTASGRWKSVC